MKSVRSDYNIFEAFNMKKEMRKYILNPTKYL